MKYYSALFQAIKNDYLQRNNEAILAFSPNGFIYDNEDFDILNQTNSDRGKLLTKEDLSLQFNSLTSNIKSWEIDVSNNMYLKYKEIIRTLELNPTDDSETFTEQLNVLFTSDGKETPKYKKYKTYLAKYDKAIQEIQTHFLNDLSLMNDDAKVIWSLKFETLQSKAKVILSEWFSLGNKILINNALDKIYQENVLKNNTITLNELKQNVENQEKTGLNSKSEYIEMQFIPFDFTTNDSKWTHLKIDKFKLETLSSDFNKEFVTINIKIDLDEGLEKYINSAELDYCIVNINRSWFKKGIIKDYKSNDNHNCFYASKLIFIKNLSLDLDNFDENIDLMNTGIIKFGPLILKNQIYKNNFTNVSFLEPIASKEIYKSNNYSILTKHSKLTSNLANDIKTNATSDLDSTNRTVNINPSLASNAIGTVPKTNVFVNRSNDVILSSNIRPHNVTAPNTVKPNNNTIITHNLNDALIKRTFILPYIKPHKTDNTGNLILKITNKKIDNEPISDCIVSIIGINNEIIKEVLTNQVGDVILDLPFGEYNITIKKSGFESIEFNQVIAATGNSIIKKVMDPTNVVYESMYLIGVCLEDFNL